MVGEDTACSTEGSPATLSVLAPPQGPGTPEPLGKWPRGNILGLGGDAVSGDDSAGLEANRSH